jgi:MarR family transcriptional regulator, transcriptional regulator for hemolysin
MSNSKELFNALPLGRHLAILTKMYYGALTKRLEHLEIEKHYSVLVLVDKSEQKCTQQYISDSLKIDKASMVRIIDYLVKKSYLVRTSNPNDRREHWLQLTPKALKNMPEIYKVVKELNEAALKGLNPEAVLLFNSTLSVICTNLAKIPADRIVVNYKKVKPAVE